ncbi:MAG: hypothetical protein ABIO70_32850 [Pseudomonadota bacterium]
MSTRSHDDLAALLEEHWAPAATEPAAFEAGIARRHGRSQRRRAALGATLAAVALAFLALHLPAETPPAAEPVPVVQASAAANAGAWWSDAVDPTQRAYALPGTWGALDTLFLQPFDQEM